MHCDNTAYLQVENLLFLLLMLMICDNARVCVCVSMYYVLYIGIH